MRSVRLDVCSLFVCLLALSEGQYAEHVRPLFSDMAGGAAPDCVAASCVVTSESGATIRYHFDTSTPNVRLDAIALPASE